MIILFFFLMIILFVYVANVRHYFVVSIYSVAQLYVV